MERFYDAAEPGSITIDGQPIEDYDVHHLRRHTSVVAQDTILFSTTIRENSTPSNSQPASPPLTPVGLLATVLFGVRPEELAAITDEVIKEACVKAAAWKFIQEFPNKLETVSAAA